MKLQKLTIHNLASIEQAEINFEDERLKRSGVYLITGDTGSGKSTILDAICLALYNKVPRMERTHIQGKVQNGDKRDMVVDDPRQLLRDGAGEGYARLSFCDTKGTAYEAEWSVNRANKKPDGKMQDSKWTLAKEGKPTNIQKSKLRPMMEEIIGLTYEQFCRTTMLAQGEFTRFLDSSDDEKSAILEKLTDTGIYSKIGKKIYEISKAKGDALEAEQKNIPESMPDEQRKELEEEKKQIDEQDLPGIVAKIAQERKKHDWLTKNIDFANQKNQKEEAFLAAKAKVEAPESKADEKLVTQWTNSIDARQWKKDIDAAKGVMPGAKRKLQQSLQGLRQYIQTKTEEQQEQQTKLDKELTLQFKQLQKECEELQTKYDDFAKKVNDKKEEVKALGLDVLRKQRDSITELLGKADLLQERIKSLDTARDAYQKAGEALDLLQKENDQLNRQIEDECPKLESARLEKEERKAAYEALKKTVEDTVRTLRAELKEGDLCPVCGQRVSKIMSDEFWQQKVDEKKHAFDKAQETFDAINGRIQEWRTQLKTDTDRYNKDAEKHNHDTSVSDAEDRVIEACADCGIEATEARRLLQENALQERLNGLKDKAQKKNRLLDEQIQDGGKQEKALTNMLSLQTMKLKEKNDKEASKNDARKAIEDARKKIDSLEQDISDQKDKLEDREKAATAYLSPEELHEAVEKGAYRDVNDIHSSVAVELTALKTAKDTLDEKQPPLTGFIAAHPDYDLDALLQYASWSIDQKRKELESRCAAFATATEEKKTAEKAYDDHQAGKPEIAEGDTVETLSATIHTLEDTDKKELIERRGRIVQQLEDDDKKKQEQNEAAKRIEELKAEYETWNRLCTLFGSADGKDFRTIAQRFVLAGLIQKANEYMKSLYGRYTLVGTPGTFIISLKEKDENNQNRKSQRASVTLSGGESFLVSLALALALSDMGDELHVDTLFIDEGFGTLSGEPLDNAINTLKTLPSKVNRRVGIISHIKELQDLNRIPVQIQVKQNPRSTSSTIEIVPVFL